MLKTGDVVEVEVRAVAVFGVFCRHEEEEILVRIPEISWTASFCSCEQFAQPGERLTVKIIHVDVPTGKISASIKALHPNPWTTGELAPGVEHQARIVRYVEKADRCEDGSGYLIELIPGAYVMLCTNGRSLEASERVAVVVRDADFGKCAVRVARK
jgi:predicted RNA-binding protein with RPS1 domain